MHLFQTDISEEFIIGYDNYRTTIHKTAKWNLPRAISHPEAMDEYLQTEVSLGRVVNPFSLDSFPVAHISRFGVIP